MISTIIAFRDWSLPRLSACVAALRDYEDITEIVVVDFGSREPLAPIEGCKVVRTESDTWCLSEANNIGIAEAANDVVLKIDADVRFGLAAEVLHELAATVQSGEVAFYNLQATDVDIVDGEVRNPRLRPSWGEGCCNLFHRQSLIEIGGFDTRYFDYGGEDNDICQRLRRYGRVVENVQTTAILHERHAPSEAQASGRFTAAMKDDLLSDQTIFRANPFRFSSYRGADVFGPAITVAIATTARNNREAQLHECLTALARQSFQDFEVRICENGSDPAERLDLTALQSNFPSLDLHLHQIDAPSIPIARNLITEIARGFYIAVHDDDDISFPRRFEEQLACLAREPAAHGCHSAWLEFDEDSHDITMFKGQPRDINEVMKARDKITLHSTGFYRRDVLQAFPYNETMVLGSDYDLCVRMLLAGLNIPHALRFHCLRRLHTNSVSSSGYADQREVARVTNSSYRYFLGGDFISAVQSEDVKGLWVTGFPSAGELVELLPQNFGAFHIEMALPAALELGLDPLFDLAGCRVGGVALCPAFRGYGKDTHLVVRSVAPMSAGDVRAAFNPTIAAAGGRIVAANALTDTQNLIGLQNLTVEAGERKLVSRRLASTDELVDVFAQGLLDINTDEHEVGFFQVNYPKPGVHVLIGQFADPGQMQVIMNRINGVIPGFVAPYTGKGLSGDFL